MLWNITKCERSLVVRNSAYWFVITCIEGASDVMDYVVVSSFIDVI